jgi:hypothetical protein
MPIDTEEMFDIDGLTLTAFEVDPTGESTPTSLTTGYGMTEIGASVNGKSCCCSVSCLSCA